MRAQAGFLAPLSSGASLPRILTLAPHPILACGIPSRIIESRSAGVIQIRRNNQELEDSQASLFYSLKDSLAVSFHVAAIFAVEPLPIT